MNYLFPQRGQRETWPWLVFALWAVLTTWIFLGSAVALILNTVLQPTAAAPWANYTVEFSGFLVLLLALVVAVRWLGRPARSLVTAGRRINLGQYAAGAGIWSALLAISTGIAYIADPGAFTYTFEAATFVVALIVLLAWLPIQTGAEELLFRGFVPQMISKATRRPVVITGLSSLLFALPHLLNPEAAGAPWAALVAYGALGWGWAAAAYRLGSLEIAMGAHLANNFFGLLLVGYENSAVAGSAIFTTPPANMADSAPAAVLTGLIWLGVVRLLERWLR